MDPQTPPQIPPEESQKQPFGLPFIIIFFIFCGLGLAAFLFFYSQKASQVPAVSESAGSNVSDSIPFQKINGEYVGTLILTGYLSLDGGGCGSDDTQNCNHLIKYANFNIIRSDTDLIYDFLKEWQGNSYIGEESIRLGCYDENNQLIESLNRGEKGEAENKVSGGDLEVLLASSQSNPVKLQLTIPYPAPGQDAPQCYSLFRDFEVIK